MKTLIIFIATLFVFNISSAQMASIYDTTHDISSDELSDNSVKEEQRVQRGSLKGPKAKNHPDWKFQPTKVVVTHPASVERQVGPEAKNQKVWQDTARTTPIVKKEKKNLKGPRAKNHKPWMNR
ncbi:hypothetical protein [Tunicatimonas pelagia]|uniref:hypothetical protein n=1 Tax=Tunicatimonas pelagia TaxID=931531 RepID=UPI002665C99D|nr:hypothetical protein [Tunicatimonas pelagia]WKN40538.1 hypothetical protein P0M28_15980 [Tunicatimonas pelagia]